MKTKTKGTNKGIELAVWQLVAILIAAIACLLAIVPLISRYRLNPCTTVHIEDTIKTPSSKTIFSPIHHKRYVRNAHRRDQCDSVPPLCSATTTMTTNSSQGTTRTTVSTVSVTRPLITAFSTTPRTTTPDPWANGTRPYNSWRLPTFAKPIDYTLHIACPDCFNIISDSATLAFNGQVTIRINISNATDYLVLHAKNLNITQATITAGGAGTGIITYIPEYEMIYISFVPTTIAVGEITLLIDYTGIINQRDQTGFYRELFWKPTGDISYVLAANFQPIHARQAFPCFDEPHLQATFTLTLDHPQNSTIALSNNIFANQTDSMTTFEITPALSSYSFAWVILPLDEFIPVAQVFANTTVTIWIRLELISESNINLNQTFDIIDKTLQFVEDYLNISSETFPTKLDFIGIPDLILDEKATSSLGLLTFREEFLSVDFTLNSAERLQTTTKIIVEHILQMWFSKVNWWDNLWFDKSLSSFLAYKMIDSYYPAFNLMEQFPLREMVPLMIDDFKPNALPISNKNLTTNEQILDSLSTDLYSKGAALLRLLEYLVDIETFQSAVRNILPIDALSNVLETFYSNFDTLLNTTTTVETFLSSWLEERNYPRVTIDFIPKNDTVQNATVIFRQTRYSGSFQSDQNSIWTIYIECDLGGIQDVDSQNLTANHDQSRIRFLFDSPIHTIELDEDYLWIKCNKDFYSYQVTEYISDGNDQYRFWRLFELLFKEDVFSNNDRGNLLNDAFLLPYGGEGATYDQTLDLVRELFSNPVGDYIPWSVFVWHWNSVMGIEEHSKYFRNFKQFATRQTLAPFSSNINNILTVGTDHQERLLKSMFFELLCRVQNPNALTRSTELFRLIPSDYFSNSSSPTNVDADYLSTVIYYHIQNINDIEEWDNLWIKLTENRFITSQQRNVFLRALSAAKEIWRLKSLLEMASNTDSKLIKSQEFFDVMTSMSQNPNGRDVVWNFYRENYQSLLDRFGPNNYLFNQLITNLVQSFENKYFYSQIINFINQYPSSSSTQRLAIDQILINIQWLNDGLAEYLDDAISAGDRHQNKN